MALTRTSLMLALLSGALGYACGESSADDPTDFGGGPAVVGTPGGMTGGTTGTPPGGTTGVSAGGTPGGTPGATPGSTPGTAGAMAGGVMGGSTPGGRTGGTTSDAGARPGGTTSDAGTMSDAGTSGPDGGAAGDGGTDVPPVTGGDCPGLPAVTDFAAKGPFDVKVISNAGPVGTYYLYRPDAKLGMNGFKHPVAVWGNGILTTADQYQKLLGHFASHGFVVIACPSSSPEQPCLNDGMEWLIKQNSAEGPLKGKLDVTKEITLGYSWGGGAQIDTSVRPNVKASISFHGMPARNNPWSKMHAPLLLFTSTGDTFVSAEGYVLPNYNNSKVPTFYSQLQESVGHLYPIDEGAVSCVADIALGGPCAAAVKEQAPAVAWMRRFACGDTSEAVKKYFYGPDAVLCKSPWKCQNKPADAWK